MGFIQKKNTGHTQKKGEFDFDNLPTGHYTFTGEEGIIIVEVDSQGEQKWDFKNWFSSLDPDEYASPSSRLIEEVKKRLNVDTGIVAPRKKIQKQRFFQRIISLLTIKRNSV